MTAVGFVYDDGGRVDAGFRGTAGDCVTRAVAIATGSGYRHVYDELWQLDRERNGARARGPRDGYPIKLVRAYLTRRGWEWTATVRIGSGCRVHLRADELPDGPVICRVTHHLCAVVDGVLHDIGDCSRGGTRCVYGYWRPGA